MNEIFKSIVSIQAPFNMVILVVLYGCAASTIGGIAAQVRKYVTHRDEMELKRELVASGMTADEIERVVRAGHSNHLHS